MGTGIRRAVIAAFVGAVVVLLGACSSSPSTPKPSPTPPTTSAATSVTAPTTETNDTTTSIAPSATTTTSGSQPTNLTTTDAVRAALVPAFAAGQHIDVKYVAGTVAGSVFYAYDPVTRAYWVVANFSPTDAAADAHERLNGSQDDPTIQFQGGPWVLSRREGSAWTLVGDTGGLLCPPRPPASVLKLWGKDQRDCS